jgi:hypothetical protein
MAGWVSTISTSTPWMVGTHPEDVVHEAKEHILKLVAVEFIVPSVFVDPANPPELLAGT